MSYYPNTQTSADLARRLASVRASATRRHLKETRTRRIMDFVRLFMEALAVGAFIGAIWFAAVAWLVFVR